MENNPQQYTMPSSPTGVPNPYNSPNSPWRLGHLIYFNRMDPRSLVPKYSGLGFTFNFARPSSLWITMLPLLIMGAVLLFVLFVVPHFSATILLSLLLPLLLFILFLILFVIHIVSIFSSSVS